MIQPGTMSDVLAAACEAAAQKSRVADTNVERKAGQREGIALLRAELADLRSAVLVRTCERCEDCGSVDTVSGMALTRRMREGPLDVEIIPEVCPVCMGYASPSYVIATETFGKLLELLAVTCGDEDSDHEYTGRTVELTIAVLRKVIPSTYVASEIGTLNIGDPAGCFAVSLVQGHPISDGGERDGIHGMELIDLREHNAEPMAILAGPAITNWAEVRLEAGDQGEELEAGGGN